MITNERQYRITRAQLTRLAKALSRLSADSGAPLSTSPTLARAERDALRSQIDELRQQVRDYEVLKSGAITTIEAGTLAELPELLIKARIARGLSQKALADLLKIKEQQIQRYEAERYSSASLERLQEIASVLRLAISEIAEFKDIHPRPKDTSSTLEWERFPLAEMCRRQWFQDFSGSLADAQKHAEYLLRDFVESAQPTASQTFLRHRVRSGSNLDSYSLLAWQCRILTIAGKQSVSEPFGIRKANRDWLHSLVSLSRHDDGPRQVREHLGQVGIRFVVEPHLPHTYLDGAALLLKDKAPVIGLTLRYDRLDNFWFVLLHEVAHVLKHLNWAAVRSIFDDLDGFPDEVEREADAFAADQLIPKATWDIALARYVRSEDSVTNLACELGISPAIIAGRIRAESENFTILSRLVGQGDVRRQFPEAQFGL